MMEIRIIQQDEIRDGLIPIGKLPTGELVVDSCGDCSVGRMVTQGRRRYADLPLWISRYVNPHKWAGE